MKKLSKIVCNQKLRKDDPQFPVNWKAKNCLRTAKTVCELQKLFATSKELFATSKELFATSKE